MKPTIKAVRAIGAEFIRRKIRPLLLGGVCIAVVLAGLGIWLVTVNAWWWLFLAPVLFLVSVFTVLAIVATLLLRLVDAAHSKEQRTAVRSYADALDRVTENVGTPYPVIVARVVKDFIWPSDDGFIAEMSRDSKTLAPGFRELVRLFG